MSNIIKIFEKVVKKYIVKFIEENNIIRDFQRGFRSKRSCLTKLNGYHNSFINAMKENKSVDAIYLDFVKAYNKVDHEILLPKIAKAGINSKLGKWIQAFLTGRKQMTYVDGAASKSVTMKS